jgi:hypothetical protein
VNDPTKFSASILNVLNNEGLRKTMIEKGRIHAGTFTSQNQAEKLLELYALVKA